MRRIILLFSVCFLASAAIFAQQVKVLDRSDLQPIPQVSIYNPSKTHMVVTNTDGVADLSAFSADDSVFFNHVAFQPYVVIKSKLPASGVIYLNENIVSLNEFVITGNRAEDRRSDLPYRIEVIQAKEIQFGNPQNTGIMLEQSGEVFVQTSQMGGGSIVLRGLEANRVLMVVDGIRMNTAIYRGGHLQSAITVDPLGLASTEVLFGPGSTLYGSDAMGGVINFITKDPTLSTKEKFEVHGNVLGRFSSANLEKTGGINLNLGWKKLAVLLNFSYSDFDDLKEGKVKNPAYGTFGERLFYQERTDGKDVTVENDKPWVQVGSAYSQYNLLGKLLFRPGAKSRYTLNFQYSNSSNIPRYDRLTEMKNDSTMTYAEWYYGPQLRILGSLKAEYDLNGVIFDHATVILAYQKNNEDRIQRDFGSSKKKYNLETVSVYSLNADFSKRLTAKDELRYGLEVSYNDVGSEAYNENIKTDNKTYDRATRYPDEKGNMMYLSAYLSNKWKFSLVGSTGFRAPNIDDLTKINVVVDNTIVLPNPDLGPEYSYNAELTIAKTFVGKVRLEGTAWYNWLRNAMVVRPLPYNGQDSILVDGQYYHTYAPQNTGQAYVCGVQGSLLAQVTRSFSIVSNLTYTYGWDETNEDPLDHIPPFFGMTSFRMEVKKFKGDFYVMYNGWKRISQYSSSGEDNQKYATQWGMPSWYTLNLKLSYQVIKYLNVELGMENILDENYRKFASGVNAPGRNVILSLRASL